MFGNRTKPQPGVPSSTLPPLPPPAPNPNQPARVGFETVIGAHTSMKGEINANANIRIDGNFEGAIHVEGNVMIGEGARVNASIQAHNISVFGSVHGNLSGHKVTIGRTGRVWGDLNAATFSTEEGAYLDGRISMTHHPAARGEQPALASANEAPTILTEEANDLIEAEVVDDER